MHKTSFASPQGGQIKACKLESQIELQQVRNFKELDTNCQSRGCWRPDLIGTILLD